LDGFELAVLEVAGDDDKVGRQIGVGRTEGTRRRERGADALHQDRTHALRYAQNPLQPQQSLAQRAGEIVEPGRKIVVGQHPCRARQTHGDTRVGSRRGNALQRRYHGPVRQRREGRRHHLVARSGRHDLGQRIDRRHLASRPCDRAFRKDIGLGDDDAMGRRPLCRRLLECRRLHAPRGVEGGDHAHPQAMRREAGQLAQDRSRLRKTAGLQDDAAQRSVGIRPLDGEQRLHRVREVGAGLTTDAAVRQHGDGRTRRSRAAFAQDRPI